jgi:hypothetical protein
MARASQRVQDIRPLSLEYRQSRAGPNLHDMLVRGRIGSARSHRDIAARSGGFGPQPD